MVTKTNRKQTPGGVKITKTIVSTTKIPKTMMKMKIWSLARSDGKNLNENANATICCDNENKKNRSDAIGVGSFALSVAAPLFFWW